MTMTLNEYQNQALQTAIFPQRGEYPGLMYLGLGLTGESGEITDHIKKGFRYYNAEILPARKKLMRAELGDVLWYVAVLASELGFTLDEVAKYNTAKLMDRMQRGVLGGSGDNR